MLDFFAYVGAQDKLCSDKTITQFGVSGQDIEKYCEQIKLIDLNLRDKIINYTVTKEDTLETIAVRFNISMDTIRWENNLISDSLNEGQILKILPVTGVAHQVENGDTIDSIAEKYNTTTTKIIDYPFNEYADPLYFTVIPGKIIIVPDGIKK